jgi:hypothetical protein
VQPALHGPRRLGHGGLGVVGQQAHERRQCPPAPLTTAVESIASTYRPDTPKYSVEDLLTLTDLGLWQPGTTVVGRNIVTAPFSGGDGTRESSFSPNAWHSVEEVRDGMGVPNHEFDRIRLDIRQMYRRRLDWENTRNLRSYMVQRSKPYVASGTVEKEVAWMSVQGNAVLNRH